MGVAEDGFSVLLEFAASDNLDAFRSAVEKPNSGLPVDPLGLWYTRHIGSNKMSYELRTPLMVAALYGSVSIVDYIIRSGKSDVNRVSGSDGVTALHCAVVGGSVSAASVVDRLIAANADANILDGNGRVAAELIPRFAPKKQFENLLYLPETATATSPERQILPDINNGVYSSDEFRMYGFKIKPCSRAYTHDWTECPFAHPGENARRRDPTKYQYTCVPCPDFKKGSCKKNDECEFAHGVFESWLHPAQYRTRLCKDETGCSRKVCFFAHRREELRPVYQSTGSAIPGPDMGMSPPLSPSQSPKRNSAGGVTWQGKSSSPPSLQLPGSRLRSSLNARDIELIKIEIQQQQQQTHNFLQRSQIQSPGRWDLSPAPRTFEPSSAILNSRASAFAQRSQSFGGYGGANGVAQSNSVMAEWGSPKGRAEWGVQGDELNKLRKSNSFGLRGDDKVKARTRTSPPGFNEPDVSWVSSLVKEEGHEMRSPWVEQLYMDQQLRA